MKKTLSVPCFVSLALALALLAAACAPAPAATAPTPQPSDAPIVVEAPELPTAAPELVSAAPEAPTVPTELTDVQTGALSAMHPLLDSILRSIGIGAQAAWTPAENGEQLWTALYLLGVNWCSAAPGTANDGAHLTVPEQVLSAWAAALNNGVSDLPAAQPAFPSMRYDEGAKAYVLELSDVGASETRIDEAQANSDGTYSVKLGLYDEDGARLGGLDFVLADAPADPTGDGAFAYVVRAVTPEAGA